MMKQKAFYIILKTTVISSKFGEVTQMNKK